jgi:pilus assembly protein CpaF
VQVEVLLRAESHPERALVIASDGCLTLGRHPGSTICLESARVSRTHARVYVGPASMRLEDVSTNGTVIGDRVLQQSSAHLPYGTPFVVGEYTVVIQPVQAPVTIETADDDEPGDDPIAAALDSVGALRIDATPADGVSVDLRREVHKKLLDNMDLATIEPARLDDPSLRPKVLAALRKVVKGLESRLPAAVDRDALLGELVDEALGLGPLERFLADPAVSEIMVVDPETIYVERAGKLVKSDARFTDDERVRSVIERIITPLGRRIDESSPLVDARLRDGSRVNAVIRPLALRGSCITIRKFAKTPLTMDRLIDFGALTPAMATLLTRSVIAKRNVVIAGGTGSGKTTLLNVLSGAIPGDERVVTIEDAAELQLTQPHVVSLETRPANMEGKGEYTIRDLVKNALRMRPDRIVVGECRGGEALDMLQAMNTGHDGSLTTTHANSPREAVARLETLVLMAGLELPVRAIREQIAGAVHLLVQQSRLSDGSRKVTQICEVTGIDDDGTVALVPLFQFVRTGTGSDGKVLGEFRSTGFLPSYLNDLIVMGLIKPGEAYL